MIDQFPTSPRVEKAPPPRDERRADAESDRFQALLAGVAGTGPKLPVMPDGSLPPESAHPIPDQARIFNQNGFFAAPQDSAVSPPTTTDPAASDLPEFSVGEPTDSISCAPSFNEPHLEVFLGILPGRGLSANRAPVSARTPHRTSDSTILSVPDGAVPVAEFQAGSLSEPETEAAPTQSTRTRFHGARALSSLHVAIRDIEQGMRILVAAQALSAEERQRLADEIAALLSRHGLVPRDVRVAGPAHVHNSGKR